MLGLPAVSMVMVGLQIEKMSLVGLSCRNGSSRVGVLYLIETHALRLPPCSPSPDGGGSLSFESAISVSGPRRWVATGV